MDGFDRPGLLADWDADRTGVICALVEATDQMPKRDELVRQLREACAYFEEGAIGVVNVPNVPMSLHRKHETPADLAAGPGGSA